MPDTDYHRLLESAITEEHYFLNAHQERVQFYSSLISTVLGATIAGGMTAKESSHYCMLLVGPVLVVALSVIAVGGTSRIYQRFLEAVAMKAKLEQLLNLHLSIDAVGQAYWQGEPILTQRHMAARTKHEDSFSFISANMNKGYQRHTRNLFILFAFVGIILAGALIVTAFNPPKADAEVTAPPKSTAKANIGPHRPKTLTPSAPVYSAFLNTRTA